MPGESPLSMMRTPDRPLPRRTAWTRPRTLDCRRSNHRRPRRHLDLSLVLRGRDRRADAHWLVPAGRRGWPSLFMRLPIRGRISFQACGPLLRRCRGRKKRATGIFGRCENGDCRRNDLAPTSLVGDVVGPLTFADLGQSPRFTADWTHGRDHGPRHPAKSRKCIVFVRCSSRGSGHGGRRAG